MNELFGEGVASYVEIRDQFASDEFLAWLAFVGQWDADEKLRDATKTHDSVMAAAAKAVRS